MSFTTSWIYKAVDQYSPVTDKINKSNVIVARTMKKVAASTSGVSIEMKKMGVEAKISMNKMSVAAASFGSAMTRAEMAAKKYNDRLDITKRKTENLVEINDRLRNTALKMTVGITLPIGLMGKAMVNAASNAVETRNKFNEVFSDVRGEANKVADAFARDFGVASSTSQKLLSDTGDLLVGFGFTGEAALDVSKRVNELSADLASFQNFEGGAERASIALTKALLGETESAKALGVVIRQSSPEYIELVKNFQATEGMTLLQAKAMTALTIATSQSKKAIGDIGRTFDDYANVSRRAGERTRDLMEKFGVLLLPVVLDLTNKFIELIDWLGQLSTPTKNIILLFAGLVAIVGPLLLLFSFFTSAIIALYTNMIFLGGAAKTAAAGLMWLFTTAGRQAIFWGLMRVIMGTVAAVQWLGNSFVVARIKMAAFWIMANRGLIMTTLTAAFAALTAIAGGALPIALRVGAVALRFIGAAVRFAMGPWGLALIAIEAIIFAWEKLSALWSKPVKPEIETGALIASAGTKEIDVRAKASVLEMPNMPARAAAVEQAAGFNQAEMASQMPTPVVDKILIEVRSEEGTDVQVATAGFEGKTVVFDRGVNLAGEN